MSELNQKSFERIGLAVGKVSRFGDRFFGGMVDRLTPPSHRETTDWAGDADWAQLQQEPLRARTLLRVAAWVLVALLVWAAFAQVDEVTRGEGKVVPTRQVQVIQTVDGGIVEEVLVREGQVVNEGQLLVRVDPTRFESNLGESKASRAALRAKALRLEALTKGTPFNPPADLLKEAPGVVAQERSLYESRRAEIAAQISVVQSQMAQRQQELNEVRARKEQAERTLELTQRELTATRPLVGSGAVSEVEVMRLERDVARLRGDREQSTAQISRVQSAISEAQRRIEEVTLASRNQMSAELSDTMSRLSALTESGKALEDRVLKADVKSPVRGTVKRVLVNTVGGVVQPGKELVEIVPLDEALILEAQVTPRDIAFLRPGLDAMVKFTAYDFSIYGGLEAVVENISADSVVDQKGNAFYIVRLRTNKPTLGENLPIIPGMVAQVDILTGKKSVLSYLLKPVLRAKANALSER
jgi:membrane fusion protein, adhesin transport system